MDKYGNPTKELKTVEEPQKENHNFFKIWNEQLGKNVEVTMMDKKKVEGILQSVFVNHLNLILKTKKKILICIRGQNIAYVKFDFKKDKTWSNPKTAPFEPTVSEDDDDEL